MADPSELTVEALREQLRGARPSPLYLLFGEEDYLIAEATDLVLDVTLEGADRSFNLDVLYGSDTDGGEVVARAVAFPMMSNRRAVVVRELERLGDRDRLVPYLQKPSDTTVLILQAVKPDFRTSMFKILRERATLVKCRRLYENEIPAWIAMQVKSLGKKIEPEAAQLLEVYVGRSLREVRNELEKLCTFVGAAPAVTAEHVRQIIGLTRGHTIFELQKSIGKGDLPRSLVILEQMLRNGESAIGIVVMLTRYFQRLMILQEGARRGQGDRELQRLLGMRETQSRELRELRQAAETFSPVRLKDCFNELLQADEKLKLSGDERTVLTLALHAILKPAN